ncbi:DUF1659 domain-containing protein [Caldisalinibacter kiritimatiensis]|uniref:DUF1659 domain-containing protein n=1 Tax=Caldisalinibacter kiritimatiensis TaxID=1304284 RepID=R1CRS5_9FIRM|nr:DUF1659 domain-containing protein [Caldisalinibacter kiritimatiensis]EOC99403.1 hypothetical protein L21TH_2584 [Caldisalinibacter kiritimatiensis]
MPVNAVALNSKLKFQFDGGIDENGKIVTKTKTYSKVKPTATNDDVYAVATSMASMQMLPLVSVRKIEEVELTQE